MPASLIDIFSHQAGQRLDNFLLTMLKGIPKTRIYQMIRKGEVRVNSKRIKPNYRLLVNDKVRLPPFYQEEKKVLTPSVERATELLKRIRLFENEDCLIVNKPHGLASHGGTGIHWGLIEALKVLPGTDYWQLAHRLDRDTSGCLIIAKHRQALLELHGILREHTLHKEYVALLAGEVKQKHVRAPLLKNILNSGERITVVNTDGKSAHTIFLPLRTYQKFATWTKIILKTGRMHQIRVHAQHIGNNLAGDSKYGDKSFNHKVYTLSGERRLCLHAVLVKFKLSGRAIQVEAPIHNDLKKILENLDKHDSE